jgi:DNA-directed RNA polymerase subunit alpha
MSKTIHTPKLTDIHEASPNSATFVIEPLHTGYGMTLGNSMRRVLLSSVAGAAVTSFNIEGTSHEFTTINGVREDVVDIMLNLKKLRFKVYSEEPQSLRLYKKGKGKITGADIEQTNDVEVVNKDLVIATIDDAKASVVMNLLVETGRGYRTVEEGGADTPTDMIALDALFSPVKRVRYKVSDTRVGRITDLDTLSITIDTDGTITAKDAFEESAAILISQYTALAGQTRIEAAEPLDASLAEDEEEPSELATSIEDLNLSARTTNALINNDIQTIKDLVTLSDAELKDLKGFGAKALDEVKDKLTELEL